MGPGSPPQKVGRAPSIYGSFLLSPNGWMYQDATWYGSRPQPRRLCARWRHSPALSKKGAEPPQFSVHVHCRQTAGWIKICHPLDMEVGPAAGRTKMPLGMEIDLGPGVFLLDGDPAPLSKRGRSPQFSAHVHCGQTAMDGSRCHLVRR